MRAETAATGYRPACLIQPTEKPEITEKEKYLKCWDLPDYRRVSPGENSVFLFRDLVKPKKGETVIDFGCGTGRGGHTLASLCRLDVTLVDFASNCLDEEVKEAIEEFPDRLRFIEKDLSKPIGLKAKYGFCVDVMEHLPGEEVQQTIKNIMDCVDGCFFQICLHDDHFGRIVGHPLHLTVKPFEWWVEQMEKEYFVRWQQKSREYAFLYVTRAAGVGNLLKHLQVNTPIDVRKDHVRQNMALGLPEAVPHDVQDIEVMILAGGPSLNDFEDDIKAKRAAGMPLITVNGVYNWAIDRGLKPSATIVADPREFNKRFVTPHVEGCRYLLCSVCHPDLVNAAPKDQVVLWHTGPNNDVAEVLREFPDREHFPVNGGSTIMLRAIPLLRMLGFKKFHIYGWDSCLREDEHHAYDQPENTETDMTKVTVEGREFKCRMWMATQAQEFITIQQMIAGEVDLAVYGDGLIAALIASYAKDDAATAAAVHIGRKAENLGATGLSCNAEEN